MLFADEPTGNLDSKNSEAVMNLLKRLNAEGHTIIMVTHSRSNAEFADRIIEVEDGRLVEGASRNAPQTPVLARAVAR
jgi:ABC-type lipoprotein export system ATPase subunit